MFRILKRHKSPVRLKECVKKIFSSTLFIVRVIIPKERDSKKTVNSTSRGGGGVFFCL